MKELSLNILDIAQNSIKANAALIEIFICETDETLSFTVEIRQYLTFRGMLCVIS